MTQINWRERAEKLQPTIRNWVGGRQVPSTGKGIVPKRGGRDGRLLYELNEGAGADVDQAVAAALTAFSDGRWSRLPVQQRKTVLHKLANLVEARAEELALLDCLDVGKPIGNALREDVPMALNALRDAADGAERLFSRAVMDGPAPNLAYQVRKPVGVVGGIIGWNFPLLLAAMKAGPALMMGNSLVLKPSEFTSLSAARLAELALEAGVPEGVFNVVHGTGAIVGDALARHRDVGLLTFTGSGATGKQLMVAAGQSNMKRLMLECGGKSPYIIFDDCPEDLDFVAQAVVQTAFPNQGEVCSAGTRVLVQEGIKDRLIPKLIEQASKVVPGDPLDPEVTFGALLGEAHMNKVIGYIESGKKEGARLIHAGRRVEPVKGGCYLEPSIFADVNNGSRIAREEIFGPVLSLLSFRTEEEALLLANDTTYGLVAYVCTTNLGRAHRLGQRLNAGAVLIMGTSTPAPLWESLGIEPQKQSGFGAEGGLDGLASYTTTNVVYVQI
jgi:acyl-CoA reductase-like NAD-dependent aldehyde dehydrogenase